MTTPLFQPALAGITLVPAAVAAAVDWRSHRVPDLLVALVFVPALLAIALAEHRVQALASIAVGGAAMALPLLTVHLVAPAAMGFGDVKLAAALGAGLGVVAPESTLSALAVATGLTLVAATCRRRSAIQFAPGLVLGAAAALAFGAIQGWRFLA